MALSLIGMALLIMLAERKGRLRLALGIGVLGLAAAQLLAGGGYGMVGFWFGLWLYFTAFNYLEAALPSLVSKAVYAGGKGTALGVYATFQFLGAFFGGGAGGLALELGGIPAVLALCAGAALLWFPIAVSTAPPRDLTNLVIRLPSGADDARAVLEGLRGAEGVADMLVMEEEGAVYLKVDAGRFDRSMVEQGAAGNVAERIPPIGGQTA